jgi:ABC-type sugar transport system substrate-binding protein
MSEHGFGKKFTEETPFIIAVVGKNDDHSEVLKKEAEEALKNNPDFLAGRIKIDGFVAPAGL